MGKKATNAVPAPRNAPAPAPAPAPMVKDTDWPPISQKDYLEVDVFEPDQILLIHNFLDPAECKAFCSFLEKLPLVVTPAAKRGEADRVNDRISIPSPSFAESLWTALGPHVGNIPSFQTHLSPPARASAFNSNIRLYRYTEGQYFGAHYDDSIRDPKTGMWSEWTLLVYLTGEEDGVEGGQTVFYKPRTKKTTDEIVPPLTRGTALLHRHGKECMLHEGRTVLKGKKMVLRSDLMFVQPKP